MTQYMTSVEVRAILDAVGHEVNTGGEWDEIKGLTLEQLVAGNQQSIIEDLYDDDPRDRPFFRMMIEYVQLYDRLNGTSAAQSIPGELKGMLT